MIRLLLDQGLPRSAVRLLGDVGWNVVHAGDIGMARSSDSDILDYARRERRVCVTLDADFHAHLAVSGAARPSTVRVRIEGLNGCALAELLKKVWPVIGDALDRGGQMTPTGKDMVLRADPILKGQIILGSVCATRGARLSGVHFWRSRPWHVLCS